jgi:hypothetical protein
MLMSLLIPFFLFCLFLVDDQIDDRIPDVSSWSVEQVSKYLEEQGYPVQAAVFKDHVSMKIRFNFMC